MGRTASKALPLGSLTRSPVLLSQFSSLWLSRFVEIFKPVAKGIASINRSRPITGLMFLNTLNILKAIPRLC